jgi:hypothetical protein
MIYVRNRRQLCFSDQESEYEAVCHEFATHPFLEVFADLVIELKALLKVLVLLLAFVRGRLRWLEKGEERIRGDEFPDDASLVGV